MTRGDAPGETLRGDTLRAQLIVQPHDITPQRTRCCRANLTERFLRRLPSAFVNHVRDTFEAAPCQQERRVTERRQHVNEYVRQSHPRERRAKEERAAAEVRKQPLVFAWE